MRKLSHILKDDDTIVLIKNISGSFVFKVLQTFLSFSMMPMYMTYFTNDAILGVWFTILSFLNWIVFFDIGIGNGLRNKLTKSTSLGNEDDSKKIISSGYFIILLISCLLLIVGISIIYLLDWNVVLNISNSVISSQDLRLSLLLIFISTIVHFYLKIISSILHSYRLNNTVSFITFFSTLILFFYLLIFKNLDSSVKLFYITIAYSLSIVIPYFIATLVFFIKKKNMIPTSKNIDKVMAKSIAFQGLHFFWIQVTLMIINTTNQFIVTYLLGPEITVEYQIYFKMFNLFITLFTLISNPIWSSVSKAFVEKKFVFIKKIRDYLYIFSGLYSIGIFVFIFLAQWFVNLWLSDNSIQLEFSKLLFFSVYCSTIIILYSITSIANGIGYLRSQMIWNTIGAIIKIPISVALLILFKRWEFVVLFNALLFIPSILDNHFKITKKIIKEIAYV